MGTQPLQLSNETRLEPIHAPLYDPRYDHDACGVGFVARARTGTARDTSRGTPPGLPGLPGAPKVLPLALEALAAMAHRGARAADARTGDGTGLSFPLTRRFKRRIAVEAGAQTLDPGRTAVGMCFLPANAADRAAAEARLDDELTRAGLPVAGWRDVPVDACVTEGRAVGETPAIRQVVVERPRRMARLGFARRLLIARRRFEVWAAATPRFEAAAVVSLSADTVVYKGLFIGPELGAFYRDLHATDLDPAYAIFHQRYSTNTFPSWRLAQPFRYLAHNGEINTIRANRELMRGRRNALGAKWARELADAGPLLSPDGSDSLSLDEALELMVAGGRRADAALMELIPSAPTLAAAFEGGSGAIEPWDGPAALVFGDGRRVGALLDRNGLRPAAYEIYRDGLVIAASEAGCVDLPTAHLLRRGRLGPGEVLVVDTRTGQVLNDSEAKSAAASVSPGRGLSLVPPLHPNRTGERADTRQRVALGLDAEVVRLNVRPMALDGKEAVWSMGDDTPVAPLARKPRRLTAFLRQAFAQVTNPPIDPERERTVMSLEVDLGPRHSLLGRSRHSPTHLRLESPILNADDWHGLAASTDGWRVVHLDATWPVRDGAEGMRRALDRLAERAVRAVRGGAALLAVSDRRIGRRRAPIPTVLALGRIHQALLDAGLRSRIDIAAAGGDLFDIHDVAMTLAAGASAVHPWLLFQLGAEVAGSRGAEELGADAARANLHDALEHALRKVLARMGISQVRSYVGGQIFEALGVTPELAAACFPAAPLHPGGMGLDEFANQALERHAEAFAGGEPSLIDPGRVRFRGTGEYHAFSPQIAKALQAVAEAPADGAAEALAAYRSALARDAAMPRDLLDLIPDAQAAPVAVEEVEAASSIVRRFVSSAMSLGALSPEAHQALAIGMARLGASANTGEGGEDPAWYTPLPNGDSRESAIKQVASARFGVTAEYLARAEQLEIKMAQGSKPGEGGQLPGKKVTAFIAALRRGQEGMTMISPPPHHDIYSIEDLAQLITDLRAINPTARIGVKLVASAGIGTIAAGVAKAHADYIMVSGHAGGTGASPLSSIKSVGIPWELGLAEVHQVLVRNHLRDRVVLRVDGGLQTGRDVVVAALLGAEEFGFGTSALVALGCDMARQCHLDTCPTGIATQREDLRAKFTGTPEQVVAFFTSLAEDVRRELGALGFSRLGDAVGRIDRLRAASVQTDALDLCAVLAAPAWGPPKARRSSPRRDLARRADVPIASETEVALVARLGGDDWPRSVSVPITTRDRTFGAALSGLVQRGGKHRSMTLRLEGAAGQSFGAFLTDGLRLELTGVANDYVAKGLSGGTVVVRPPSDAPFEATDEAIAGNTCLYGATGGRLHLIGRAGMRFAVRNSGAVAVVEGAGTHAGEYMTGGVVVVLGATGGNVGAGMTGGRFYLYDPDGLALGRLNADSVVGRSVLPGPMLDELQALVAAHSAEGSRLAASLLARWDAEWRRFLVVEPVAVAGSAVGEVAVGSRA